MENSLVTGVRWLTGHVETHLADIALRTAESSHARIGLPADLKPQDLAREILPVYEWGLVAIRERRGPSEDDLRHVASLAVRRADRGMCSDVVALWAHASRRVVHWADENVVGKLVTGRLSLEELALAAPRGACCPAVRSTR